MQGELAETLFIWESKADNGLHTQTLIGYNTVSTHTISNIIDFIKDVKIKKVGITISGICVYSFYCEIRVDGCLVNFWNLRL